jgi:hypothetical protein
MRFRPPWHVRLARPSPRARPLHARRWSFRLAGVQRRTPRVAPSLPFGLVKAFERSAPGADPTGFTLQPFSHVPGCAWRKPFDAYGLNPAGGCGQAVRRLAAPSGKHARWRRDAKTHDGARPILPEPFPAGRQSVKASERRAARSALTGCTL